MSNGWSLYSRVQVSIGGTVMIKRIARYILRREINDLEHDWWHAGVNQQRYEPETCTHGLKSHFDYWGEEE